MIEKLKGTERDYGAYITTEFTASNSDIFCKINELVDVVNSIISVQDRMIGCTTLDIPESYKTDHYAEQRKWIGKLCKFWDYDGEEKRFGILECINKNNPYPYCTSGDWWYGHCEPVKSDDDAIYKGE